MADPCSSDGKKSVTKVAAEGLKVASHDRPTAIEVDGHVTPALQALDAKS